MKIGIIAKRALLIALALGLVTVGACAWIGYGSPLRKVESSGGGHNADFNKAFFVNECVDGSCVIDPEHVEVMHFVMGDGIMAYPGDISGEGRNPVALARGVGLHLLPEPDYQIAALKWCTIAEIFRVFRYHGDHYIVPMTNDPLATARCVRNQIPRQFSVAIGDPMGRKVDKAVFKSLAE